MHTLKKLVAVSVLLFQAVPVLAQNRYLQLESIVTDSARIFTPKQLSELDTKLTEFEQETTNQLVVLTVNELGYETIEMYANGTFNQNGLGQAGKDNGILLLFSKHDREVRIEIGYGLEDKITDAIASRIIRNTMIPLFKEEQYFQGIDTATDELILYLKDPILLESVKEELAAKKRKNEKIGFYIMLVFILVFFGAGSFMFYKTYSNLIEIFRSIFTGKLSFLYGLFAAPITFIASVFGLVFGIGPILVGFAIYGTALDDYEYLLEEPLHLLWVLFPLFGIAMLIALYKIKTKEKEDFKISWLKSDKNYVQQTFSSSGSSSYGSSFGSSSGGFSGGGGSSGGGGASGSW